MKLFHRDAYGFPKGIAFRPLFNLRPSAHAENAAWNDRYGHIPIPKHFHPAVAEVIELETDSSLNPIKILARQKLDEKRDVVFAVLVAEKLVKTVWCNERSDSHRTLDKSRYNRP